MARQEVEQNWPSNFVILMPTQCTVCGLHWSKYGFRDGSDAVGPFDRYGLLVIKEGVVDG
jgi:hypothetical protein